MSSPKELEKIAYNKSLFDDEQRTEAIIQLANYVPSTEAVDALSKIANDKFKFNSKQRKLAIKALGGKKKI